MGILSVAAAILAFGLFGADRAHVRKIAGDLPKDHIMVMNMCGRGDKDIFTVARALGWDMHSE